MSNNDESPEFPLRELIGFEIERGEGSATATVTVDHRHLNPHGSVHGGVPFTLIDTAMGAAAMSVAGDGNWVTTVDITTRYLAACFGGRLTAPATVRRSGRLVIHLDASVVGDDRPEHVAANGVFAVIPARG
ncbi:MAG: PaaI family thioesterase [Acidimicrobiales bacterium]